MIKLSVYLPKRIIDELRAYGDISDVTNDILRLCEEGTITLYDKPYAPNDDKQLRIDININCAWYEDLLAVHGPTSKKISVKRLLCWFFDTNKPQEFGWEKQANVRSKRIDLLLKSVINAEGDLTRRALIVPEYAEQISLICKQLELLRKELQ